MSEATKPIGFIKAVKEFFGLQPGQKLAEFSAECKAVKPDDRAWFCQEMSRELGVPVVDQMVLPA